MEHIPQELLDIIKGGEKITVEFKSAKNGLPKNIYETVCSFCNRDGGHIFLGVNDNGVIVGVDESKIDGMKKNFVTSVNNGNKIYPPLYLVPIEYEAEGKRVLYIRVPVLQDVCRLNGRIFDRVNDSDIDITNHTDEVYRLYARKNGSYFVNRVTGFGVDALRADVIQRARNMTHFRGGDHPWRSMSDEDLLRSAGLILTDDRTGREGVTLAGILLFGKDNTIMSVLPQHKTDAIYRVRNLDRYDDRD
ncbi:MAG: putative DNA binding domain-containing protein, partial [Abditibacteriota bacterium]|nr:putative DNA binding domain-containing protein [Abditibacteriota bacterium]